MRKIEPIEELKRILSYDPDTGLFTRTVTRSHNAKAGDIAGWKNYSGYVLLSFNRKHYMAHRVAWGFVHGPLSKDQEIDHKNLTKCDNRIKNLRVASHSKNGRNSKVRKHNKSGYKGVAKEGNKWRAQISVKGKTKWLGLHNSPKDAHEAYVNAAKMISGEYARAA